MTIVSNQVRCLICNEEPFSAHRHDYQSCKCGNVSVDGGMSYLRRSIKELDKAEDMSIILPDKAISDCIAALDWAEETGRNKYGTVFAIMRALRDNGYKFKSDDRGNNYDD